MAWLRSQVRRLRILALWGTTVALTAGSASGLLAPSSTWAYTHKWECVVMPYVKCYDNSGKTFNHWHLMSIQGPYTAGYCVKGEASNGGVIVFGCTNGSTFAGGIVCTNTETHAYGYSNLNQLLKGFADTEGAC